MVPPPGDGLPEDLFECSICRNVFYDPVTVSCCSKSFCRGCLRRCLIQAADAASRARCPGGCNQLLPLRLPPRSYTLQRCLEALVPEELRRREEEEAEGDEEEQIPGGFRAWQEVVAALDLKVGEQIIVAHGMPGVVIGRSEDRVKVVFDERVDFFRNAVRVTPGEIAPQLPPNTGVRIAQRVVASHNLMDHTSLIVRAGTIGTVLHPFGADRVTVQFDTRSDGSTLPVNTLFSEVQPWRKLLGGYDVGQRVAASRDLQMGPTVIVQEGVPGTVTGEYSDTRLTVQFDRRADGSNGGVNLMVEEIRPLWEE
mmetsp:Transcript_71817/g.162983  ORF Transcript_71817/g.162983 Transcript_71817/m.162983 type:complete len:311 (-) Transcript_71817:57-989(-)